ncbi:MAG: hypothetical protein K6L60_10735 [Oceanobacter sp.]
MRKLILGAILTVSLPTMADIATDLNSGLSVSEAYQNAAAACTGEECDALIAQEMLEAGVSAEMIMAAVIDSGIPAAVVIEAAADAALRAGVDVNDVMAAAANVPGVQPADAVQGVTAAAVTNNVAVAQVMVAANNAGINSVQTVAGVSQAGVSQTVVERSASTAGIPANLVNAGLNVAQNNGNNSSDSGSSVNLGNIITSPTTPGGDSPA